MRTLTTKWRVSLWLIKDATADVGVRVRRTVVVNVERPVIQVLVIVTAVVQARVTTVEVPIIRDHRLLHSRPPISGVFHSILN